MLADGCGHPSHLFWCFVRAESHLAIIAPNLDLVALGSRAAVKRSHLTIILFVAFVDLVAYGLIIPLQAVYARRLGASGLTFGLLIGVYSLMQLLFSPMLGRWSDRVGRRRVLLISIAGSVLSHTLLGVADLAHSLPLLFVARILDGISGANIATAQAYIADVTTDKDRAKGMGLFGAAFGLGFVIGPALGAGLVLVGRAVSGEAYGTCWPAFGAALIALVALFLVWRVLPESRPQAEVTKDRFQTLGRDLLRTLFGHPRLRELFTLVFFSIFAFVLLEVTFVYLCAHCLHVKEAGTGLIFTYIGVVMVIVQGGLVGRLARRFGEANLVAIGPFITAVGFLVISAMPHAIDLSTAWMLLFLGCFVVPLGHGLTGPNLSSLISRHAGARRQGTVLGVSQSMSSLARAVAPPIGGLLYDLGPSWPYWMGAALLFVVGRYGLRIRTAQQSALPVASPEAPRVADASPPA